MRSVMRSLQKALAIALLAVMLFGLGEFAAQAATTSADEAIDRAYTLSEEAGLQEEIYQQRLEEAESPDNLPKPYERVLDLNGNPVPETSLVEKTVEKARELIEDVTGE
ncbi:hypothetical protein H6F67_23405 [Microcoleus sp. FACHB-1515]|uniref:hypothetical protein n=1 Tax=Cyanophyceae TaxID=3028117 RepID=UPI0016845EA6|nr:hypothetical protein [Microcoleus sp. FACHB-1515]MBD2092801.1 hypothetical protein [Microcoleus sp. FACHB-1515]